MDDLEIQDVETDPRFPTGAWAGFFLQFWMPGRHKTDSQLTFRKGELTGTGNDWVGDYTIAGYYDTKSGECSWIKTYVGRHSIIYRGVNEGRGIWGVWEMKQVWGLLMDRGGFHIWPEGMDVAMESDEAERALKAVMRKEFGSRALRGLFYLTVVGLIAAGAVLLARKMWGF